MADQPRFQAVPTPRCCAITSSSPIVICNRPATWKGLVEVGGVTPVWCDAHKPAFAEKADGVLRVRRVAVVCQIVLTSAVDGEHMAKAEAMARLARAVEHVGGLVNLHSVSAQTGFWRAPTPPGSDNGNGGAG